MSGADSSAQATAVAEPQPGHAPTPRSVAAAVRVEAAAGEVGAVGARTVEAAAGEVGAVGPRTVEAAAREVGAVEAGTVEAGAVGIAGALLTTPSKERTPRRWRHLLVRVGSVMTCVLLWHLLATRHVNLGLVNFANVPSPAEVGSAAWKLLHSPKLWRNLSSSLLRVGYGFGAAALVGVGLGLAIGRWRWARDTLLPPLEVLRPIPAVAWIPLAILIFPSSEGSMVFITFLGALFPILLNTIHGAEAVDVRLVAAARSLGTPALRLFTEVIVPGAAPSIATGLAIGMGTCWFCLVTAEMIAGQYGIGYYTWESYTVQNYPDIIVGMLLIGVLGMGSSALIRWLMRCLMPWHRPQRGLQ